LFEAQQHRFNQHPSRFTPLQGSRLQSRLFHHRPNHSSAFLSQPLLVFFTNKQ
jgi:hypothetical protein